MTHLTRQQLQIQPLPTTLQQSLEQLAEKEHYILLDSNIFSPYRLASNQKDLFSHLSNARSLHNMHLEFIHIHEAYNTFLLRLFSNGHLFITKEILEELRVAKQHFLHIFHHFNQQQCPRFFRGKQYEHNSRSSAILQALNSYGNSFNTLVTRTSHYQYRPPVSPDPFLALFERLFVERIILPKDKFLHVHGNQLEPNLPSHQNTMNDIAFVASGFATSLAPSSGHQIALLSKDYDIHLLAATGFKLLTNPCLGKLVPVIYERFRAHPLSIYGISNQETQGIKRYFHSATCQQYFLPCHREIHHVRDLVPLEKLAATLGVSL